MSVHQSITRWYRELENGNPEAASELWNHFFERMVRLAHRRLGATPRQVRDEEDVALSAFKSLCRGIQNGRFPALNDRHELWRLLMVITSRKAHDHITYQCRQKRSTTAPVLPIHLDDDQLINQIISREPSPEFTVQMAETVQALLDRLGQDDLRTIATMKLEGYTNTEIATALQRGIATIERKLRTIRTLWEDSP